MEKAVREVEAPRILASALESGIDDAIEPRVEALDAFDCDVHQLAGGEFGGGNQMRLGGSIEKRDIVQIHERSIVRLASDIKKTC